MVWNGNFILSPPGGRLVWFPAYMLSRFSHGQLFDPMDHSLPGSPVRGILQARILKWVAMPSSWESSWPRDRTNVTIGGCASLYRSLGGYLVLTFFSLPCISLLRAKPFLQNREQAWWIQWTLWQQFSSWALGGSIAPQLPPLWAPRIPPQVLRSYPDPTAFFPNLSHCNLTLEWPCLQDTTLFLLSFTSSPSSAAFQPLSKAADFGVERTKDAKTLSQD